MDIDNGQPMQPELTIHKYDIPLIDFPSILLPVGAKILDFKSIEGCLYIWCIVDRKKQELEMIDFSIVSTGGEFLPQYLYEYIGTAVQDAGNFISDGIASGHFVWHLFKLTDKGKI